jgi:methionyl-tRNA synthetase
VVQRALGAPAPAAGGGGGAARGKETKVDREKKGPPEPAREITHEEFSRVDLRVARVISAERVEGADRLLKLCVDCGGERTIVAGIAASYEAQDVVGKHVVLVANLKPARIRGIDSHGMLLAAGDAADALFLVLADEGAAPGARVK